MYMILLDSEKHVMISYHWECQKKHAGGENRIGIQGLTCTDVDKMKGGTIETMTQAVEKSSIVQIAMSRGYQSSPNIADQVRLLVLQSYSNDDDNGIERIS